MSAPVVASTTNVANAAGTQNVTLNVPAGVQNGDLLVTLAGQQNTTASFTPGVTTLAGWTVWNGNFPVRETSGVTRHGVFAFYRIANGEPASYTWVVTDSGGQIGEFVCLRITGATATPVDDGNGQINAASTTCTAPSITGTINDLLLDIFFSAADSGQTYTVPGGASHVLRAGSGSSNSMDTDSESLSASGATGTRTSTLFTSALNIGVLLSIKGGSDPSATIWFEEWQYPLAAFVLFYQAMFERCRQMSFNDPTQPTLVASGTWPLQVHDPMEYPPSFRKVPLNRDLVGEHDEFSQQFFTVPSAPPAGWNLESDMTRNAAAPVLREVSANWEPFGGALIVPFQIPLDVSIHQLPQAIRVNAVRRTPSDAPVFLPTPVLAVDVAQFGQGNFSPQLPFPPRRRPLEDQHSRCIVIDIGDLLEKSWPAPDQSAWAIPFRRVIGVREQVQPFDTSLFQPAQVPPMIPWDSPAVTVIRAVPRARDTLALSQGNLMQGVLFSDVSWNMTWPAPFRGLRPTLIQAPAFFDTPTAEAVDMSVLMAWNAPAALPRWTRPLLAGDASPMPKLPDATEAILGAWQGQIQTPRFPIRGSAYLATAADPLRTWGFVAESMAWFSPWADLAVHRPLIQARRQTVEAVGPGNFLTSGEAPYFWLWDSGQQIPVRYPVSPARTHTVDPLAGALAGLPTGLIVVAGPYFVFQGQIYVAGIVQGDISSE